MVNGHETQDLDTDMDIVDPVEERRTLAERNERLQDQLKVVLIINILNNIILLILFYEYIDVKTRLSSITR